MELAGSALVVVVILGLWIAAALYGRDTRDGADWSARFGLNERPRRTGD
ncbi:MAG TPA: hypothetical protein VF029_01105 [Actinomycetota bacterium]